MEVKSEGGIVLASIDEIEDVILILNEAFNEKGGSEERVSVKVAGIHIYAKDGLQES